MSNYRVKHFTGKWTSDLEGAVNNFIKDNNIEVLKYTLYPVERKGRMKFIGVLEYEVEGND